MTSRPVDPDPADTIKAGDRLYAVGPGQHAPDGPTDLRLYSAVVQSIGPHDAHVLLVLADDRPILGFPKWCYRSYEVGSCVHLTEAAALRGFGEQARHRRDAAERARVRADCEVKWADEQLTALTHG